MGLRLPADLSGAGMQDMRKGCMDIDSVDILDVRQGTTKERGSGPIISQKNSLVEQ